jgi:hypothetical protein
MLAACEGMLEAGFGFSMVVSRQLEEEFAFDAIEF